MENNRVMKEIFNWLGVTVAAIIYSMGVGMFLAPNTLAAGGASGAAIVINYITKIPTGMLIMIINVPLFIVGFFVMGKMFFAKSIYAVMISSTFIDMWSKILPQYFPVTTDKLLAAIAGAVLSAIGIGLIFRFGGSTGGTDIVVKLLRRKFPQIKSGTFFLIIDSCIISSSVIVLGLDRLENALYAAIALFLTSVLVDRVLYGTDEAKLLIIISSCPERVAELLLKEIDAGVTFANGQGAYTGAEKKIIICAVRKQQFHQAKQLVCREDPSSFIIVSNASEVFGEGYKAHGAEEL